MTAQTEDSRALVGKFVDAFGDQRVDDALRLLHDEFLVHAAGDVPYSGDYSGPSGFLSSSPRCPRRSSFRRARICYFSLTTTKSYSTIV
jgi:hypothetical protein